MALLNIIALAVLKKLHNFVISFSCKRFCLQITADISKVSKSVQRNIIILNVLSETGNSFMYSADMKYC